MRRSAAVTAPVLAAVLALAALFAFAAPSARAEGDEEEPASCLTCHAVGAAPEIVEEQAAAAEPEPSPPPTEIPVALASPEPSPPPSEIPAAPAVRTVTLADLYWSQGEHSIARRIVGEILRDDPANLRAQARLAARAGDDLAEADLLGFLETMAKAHGCDLA